MLNRLPPPRGMNLDTWDPRGIRLRPDTSQVLGINYVLVDPSKMSQDKALPAGTVLRDTAYLGAGIVDSTHQRPGAQIARGE